MKREELADLLKRYASPVHREHDHLIPVMAELYQAGLTVKQLESMFPVSKKFIRNHLEAVPGFRWRAAGPKGYVPTPPPAKVEAILKKHGVRLEDLEYRPPKRKK